MGTQSKEKPTLKEAATNTPAIVVYNDDVNTFEHVICVLTTILGHSNTQAEQCTWIIHFKGKCVVKTGSIDILIPLKDTLCNEQLDARLEL